MLKIVAGPAPELSVSTNSNVSAEIIFIKRTGRYKKIIYKIIFLYLENWGRWKPKILATKYIVKWYCVWLDVFRLLSNEIINCCTSVLAPVKILHFLTQMF